jgi:hypothetical protein
MADEFDKPINEWIEETEVIEKPTYVLDPITKKAEMVIKKEEVKFKTMYNSLTMAGSFCKEQDHEWIMDNPREQIVKCSKCKCKRRLHPIKQRLEDGKIVPRK